MDWVGFLINAVIFYFVFKLGQWSVLVPLRAALHKLAKEHNIDIESLLRADLEKMEKELDESKTTVNEESVEIERVDGIYYAYGADGMFLAQGNDFRTMFQTIKDRFPGKNFRIGNYKAKFTDEELGRLMSSLQEVFNEQGAKK